MQTFSFILKNNDPKKTLNSILRKANLTNVCQNDSDFFSGDEWSDTNKPTLIIHFKSINSEKENVLCFVKDDIVKWIQDPRNAVAKWIPNGIIKGNKYNLSDIDSEGYGGRPSYFERFYKLPVGGYILPPLVQPPDLEYNEYIAVPFYEKVRIGNIYGVFGVGASHGQLPGETVYYLIPKNSESKIKDEIVEKFFDPWPLARDIDISLLNSIIDSSPGKEAWGSGANDQIKNEISKFNTEDVIKFFGGGKGYIKFMDKVASVRKKHASLLNAYQLLDHYMAIDQNPGIYLAKLYGYIDDKYLIPFIREYMKTLSVSSILTIITLYNKEYIDSNEYQKPFESDTNAYFQIYEEGIVPEPGQEDYMELEQEPGDMDLPDFTYALTGENLDPNLPPGSGPEILLYKYLQDNDYDSFKNLLNAATIDLNAPFIDPITSQSKIMLTEAVRRYGEKYIEALLDDRGADINIKDDFGRTPLMHAAAINDENIVKLLLNHGADKTIKDEIGYTAKDYAILPNIIHLLE